MTVADFEAMVANACGRKHCILTGRGATALWACFLAVDDARRKVLLPDAMCLSPAFAALYASRIPVFVDVLPQDATIDPTLVREKVAADPEVGGVLAVRLYGHPIDIKALRKVCRNANVLLIDDAAQSSPLELWKEREDDVKADVTILSFGHTKILDLGVGGAVVTDDPTLAARIRISLADLVEARQEDTRTLGETYRRLYYSIWDACKADQRFFMLYQAFPNLFRPLYLRPFPEGEADRIAHSLQKLNSHTEHRRALANRYRSKLSGSRRVRLFQPRGDCVLWRFSFLVDEKDRDSLLEKIRKVGFDASSWYPAVHNFFNETYEKVPSSCPVSSVIQRTVVNLWLTDNYTTASVDELCSLILDRGA